MKFTAAALILFRSILFRSTLANPIAHPDPNPNPSPVADPDPSPIGPIQEACTRQSKLTFTGTGWPGKETILPASCTPGAGGCSVQYSKSFSWGWTWGGGASLGVTIAEILDLEVNAGVYYTTTEATIEGVSVTCGAGDYLCGLVILPVMVVIEGTVTMVSTGEVQGEVCTQPADPHWTVYVPQTENHLPFYHASACACTNAGSGPKVPPACPYDCDLPAPP